jgi:hypothetical protein
MSELPKQLPSWPPSTLGWSTPTPPAPEAVVGWRDSSQPPRRMRASDFADKHGDWTQAGLDALAVVLRRAIERNRKGAL